MSPATGDVGTQRDLVNHLMTLRVAAIYDIFAQTCLHQFIKDCAAGKANPDSLKTQLPGGTMTFTQFMDSLALVGGRAQVETKRNANRALTRNYLKEVFRITQSFCQASGQADAMTLEPWYQFARILVNALSHDRKLRFRDFDKRCLPVTYRGVTIDANSDGKPLRAQLETLLVLCEDILDFAKDRLV